ncbi:MAG: glycosyltransferase family 87 protein, partial [Deltaproteobacteria bacterium]
SRPCRTHDDLIRSLIVFFIAAVTLAFFFSISPGHTRGDFDVYYDAGRHYLAGAPLYVPHGGLEEFKYLPLFALVFSPLSLLEKVPALYCWGLFNILLLYGMFFLLCGMKPVSLRDGKSLLFLACLFALTGRYIIADLRIGQANILLCFLMFLTMDLEIRGRSFAAAVVLAFSLTIKLFPLLFLFYFIITRRFKAAGATLAMAAVFLLLPAVHSGFGRNLDYLREWFLLLRSSPPAIFSSVKNFSLFSFFSRLFLFGHDPATHPVSPAVYAAWALSCLAFLGVFFGGTVLRRHDGPEVKYADYACLFVCALLFNPLAYLNAFVLLIVPYFFLLHFIFFSKPEKGVASIVATVLFLGFLVMAAYNHPLWRDRLLEYKPLMWVNISVCLCLGLVKRAGRREEGVLDRPGSGQVRRAA